jgi:hypothetical protein
MIVAAGGDFDSASVTSALAAYSWAMTINRFDTSSSDETRERRRQMSACRRKYVACDIAVQMSRLAAASTIPVTNAAKQENTRRSCRILIMVAKETPAEEMPRRGVGCGRLLGGEPSADSTCTIQMRPSV